MAEVHKIIMASSSSFRKALLSTTGLSFRTEASGFDEQKVSTGSPADIALARALGKAEDVAERYPGALIIGADQVLAFEGRTYGKVSTKDEAVERLMLLCGKTHQLLSAFVLVHGDEGAVSTLHEEVVEVPMTMRSFTRQEAQAYVDQSYEWQGVVGCYQYENNGINLFDQVGGDHASIIGLPLVPLLRALRNLGINPLLQPRGPWEITPA